MVTETGLDHDQGGTHICLIAGEPSGDHMGAGLMAALKGQTGGKVRFSGIGGTEMIATGKSQGFESLFPMAELSIGGIFEIIPHIPRILKRLKETVQAIKTLKPDLLVTIDSPAFAFRVSKKLKNEETLLVHYVAPSVWAWRPRRAKLIARFLDHLLMIFPFEEPYFKKWGLACTFVGNPVAEMKLDSGDGVAFRKAHGIGPSQPVLCVLPGSRRDEVNRLMPVFGEVITQLKAKIPDLAVVLPTLPSVADLARTGAQSWPLPVTVTESIDEKRNAFAASDVALAASGTVTSELAIAGVPMVIAYRLASLTAMVIRLMLKIEHVSVINLALGREIAPEFLQQECKADLITPALLPLFSESNARRNQIEGLKEVAKILSSGDKTSSQHAAEVILRLVAEHHGRQ